jgi:hypothetical protein
MFGVPPHRRTGRHEDVTQRLTGPRWRARGALAGGWDDQEDEIRERLYAKPPATERTVEVLGPIERLEDRPAA